MYIHIVLGKCKEIFLADVMQFFQLICVICIILLLETWTLLAIDMKAIKSFHMKCQQRILGIRWHDLSVTLRSLYALVSHLCLTGLPEVAMPSSDMWQKCQITLQHTRPCYAKSSYRSVDPQTLHGNIHQVDHVANGPTNSAVTTTMSPLRLCGGKPLVAVPADYLLTTTTTMLLKNCKLCTNFTNLQLDKNSLV